MANIDPVVRHMILAEDVLSDPANPKKIHIRGLIQTVRLVPPPMLPAVIDQLCALLFLPGRRPRGGRRPGGRRQRGDRPAGVPSGLYRITHPADPLEAVTRNFRLRRCVVPLAGLYWVQFWHNGRMLQAQPLVVR